MADHPKIKVLHFTEVINKDDFIDTIIRFADTEKFIMMACTYQQSSNIRDPNYHSLGIPYFHTYTGKSKTEFLKAIFRLKNLLKSVRPDILHTHHFYESLIGAFAIKLSGLPVKLIVGRHYDEELYLTTKGAKLKLYLQLEAIVNRAAAKIISPSSKISGLLKRQKVKDEKIAEVPYGFDFSALKYQLPRADEVRKTKEQLGIPEDSFLIGNFARHHTIKGQDFLLMGFSDFATEFPESCLLMVGDGPANSSLRDFSKDLMLEEKVIFAGWQRDIRLFLSACDVIIHPSLQEAFPQIMIESMAQEKPLIITPVSGTTDQVKEGETGYFIPFSNPVSIAEKLTEVKNNFDEALKTGKKAREYVLKNLDIRNIIRLYENVYLTVIK